MTDDNTLIAREQLTTKEANLKNRLYTDHGAKKRQPDNRSTKEVLYDDFMMRENKNLGSVHQMAP